jgi:low temperature requirement protein LtrA
MGTLLRPVIMRPDRDGHRPATPLELLFDLCFVVAVAALAAELHHDLSHDHVADGAITYALLFVPIWWAWMSYSWFATAFDNDDVGFRLLTGAQMLGVLAVAATIPAAADGDYAPFTVAYTLMRLPLVVQWMRAAHDDPDHRRFAQRYAWGTLAAQTLWLVGLLAPAPGRAALWAAALAVELGTPMLAVRAAPGQVFHPGHIAERYGLFTIIVLGETILAVSLAIRDSLAVEQLAGPGLLTATAALLIAFALWWTYFDSVGAQGLTRNRRAAFTWGYGHYVLFASLAAIGAATQAQMEQHIAGQDPSSQPLGIAVTVALLAMAGLQRTANGRTRRATTLLATAAATALVTLSGPALAVTATDLLLVTALAVGIIADRTRSYRDDSSTTTMNHPSHDALHP